MGPHSTNVRGVLFMEIVDKLLDPHWLLIGGIAIAVIALMVVAFPQRPK
jgi:hypothetical protein